MATGNTNWYVLSAGGDSITTVLVDDFTKFMSSLGMDTAQFGPMLKNYKPLNIGMASVGMVIYLVAGFVASIWISRRRQLA